jgi:CO/xanthine dehydrogenase FAD-binding subunit
MGIPSGLSAVIGTGSGSKLAESAAGAGEAAVADAQPFETTKYKAQIAKTVVKRALLDLYK